MTIRVSVVVPTYQRPALLKRCLAALLEQDFDPAAYEIIVADDAACDETRQLVEGHATHTPAAGCTYDTEFAAAAMPHRARAQTLSALYSAATGPAAMGPRLRYLPVTGAHGPAAARNAGWRAAAGSIIAFTDDDCVPEPEWLAAGVAALRDGAAGASGYVRVPLPDVPTDYQRDAAGLEAGEFVTANCFYRRDTLAAIGGFDERFTVAWREDSDLLFTLIERGERLVRAPDAVVVHPIRPAAWGISLRQQRKSMFNALLYKKHPQLYRQRIQPAPPWRYYRIAGALLVALAGMAVRRRGLALGGLGTWALLSGRFCAQRLRHTSHAPRHLAEMTVTSVLIPPLALFWRWRGGARFRVFFL
ncbi:MAG: glycosyltransferase family 2 protein [Roseiflexaceae bacterium]